MRRWKRKISILLALAMVFTMNTGVFAAEADTIADESAAAVEETEAGTVAEPEAAETEDTDSGNVAEPEAAETEPEEDISDEAQEDGPAAQAIDPEDFVSTGDWVAYLNGSPATTFQVSVNASGNLLIVGTPVGNSSNTTLVLKVSADKALSINKIYLRPKEAGTNYIETVELRPGSRGVYLADPSVYVLKPDLSAEPAELPGALKHGSPVLISSNEMTCGTQNVKRTLKAGDTVYGVIDLYNMVRFDYDQGKLYLSGNTPGKLVLVTVRPGQQPGHVDKPQNLIVGNTPADGVEIDDFISLNTQCFYFFFVEGNCGALSAVLTYADVPSGERTVSGDTHSLTIKSTVSDTDTVRYLCSDKELTLEELKAADFNISLNDAGNTYKVENLDPGQTYHVYYKALSGNNKFAKYFTTPLSVTLSREKVFNLKLEPNGRSFFAGDEISADDISIVLDPSKPNSYMSGGVEKPITNDEVADLHIDLTYYVRKDGETGGKALGSVSLDRGRYYISHNGGTPISSDCYYIGPSDKDSYTVYIDEGEFDVWDTDTKLVASDIKYYFGQGEDGLISNAKKTGLFADGVQVGAGDDITVSASKTLVSGGSLGEPLLNYDEIRDLKKGEKFYVSFCLGKMIYSNIAEVTVEARPIHVEAKKNYFTKKGKTPTVSAIDLKYLTVTDLYGTPYALPIDAATSISAAQPDFGSILDDNAFIKQDYKLMVTPLEGNKADVTSGNIVLTGGNAKDYAYYLAPVYSVTLSGNIVSASVNGVTREAGKPFEVESVMAGKLDSYISGNTYSVLTEEPDKTATVELAGEAELPVSSYRFRGWKKNGERLTGSSDVITADTVYEADVLEVITGFTNPGSALAVVLDDSRITYTGLRHVTDPSRMQKECFNDNGATTGIEKTLNTALAGSGDVKLEVYVGDKLLIENYDYTTNYRNNINAYDLEKNDRDKWAKKAPSVTINFKNGYSSYPTVTKYFNIHPADISVSGENATVLGCGLYSRVCTALSHDKELDGVLKTDLVNKYTGKILNSNKDVEFSDASGKRDVVNAGPRTIVVTGKGNYTGSKIVNMYFVNRKTKVKVNTLNVKIRESRINGTDNSVSFDALDTFDEYTEAIKADISANILKKYKTVSLNAEDIYIYKAKYDYSLPGAKKLNYKAFITKTLSDGSIEAEPRIFKGTYQYWVKEIVCSKITVSWAGVSANGDIRVPYVKGGATVAYSAKFDNKDYNFGKVFKLAYLRNKKPTKADKPAIALLTPKKSDFFTKEDRTAMKKDTTVNGKYFSIKKGILFSKNAANYFP